MMRIVCLIKVLVVNFVCLIAAVSAQSQTVQVPAAQDTWVYGNTVTADNSQSEYVYSSPVSTCNNAMARGYIQFDISNLPQDVEKAYLGVTHTSHDTYCYSNCDANFYFYPVIETWQDDTLNYNNMPKEGTEVFGPIHILFPNNFGNKEYDITQLYKDWKSGTIPNNGISIHSPTIGCNNASVGFIFHSSEAQNLTQRPYLKVITKKTSLSLFLPAIITNRSQAVQPLP